MYGSLVAFGIASALPLGFWTAMRVGMIVGGAWCVGVDLVGKGKRNEEKKE